MVQHNQPKTISSPSTLAVIAVPGRNLPARISCASGFSIQRWIENPLAQLILAGKFLPGTAITAKVEGDEIVFG